MGNTNYYNDDNDFFNTPYMSKSDKIRETAAQSFRSRVPTVNFTHLDEKANRIFNNEPLIELFPRWIAQTTLRNPD